MSYFYYVKGLKGMSPRLSDEWPPIGGGINQVVWNIEISLDEAELHLNDLDHKYRKTAEKDLTQQ